MKHTVSMLVATRLFDDERAEVARKAKCRKAARRAARAGQSAAEHALPPGPSPAHPRIADADPSGLRL